MTAKKALFKFSEVEAKTAKPSTINQVIKEVLRADDDACYSELEPYLVPPGLSGSRQFDQAYAVGVLLEHDRRNGGRIRLVMDNSTLTERLLWDKLQSVLRQVGFRMRHGRLVGLLEDQSGKKQPVDQENGDVGQPDID